MTTTKTGGVKVSLTLPADSYSLLEEMCRTERRSKSRQIDWIIRRCAKKERYVEKAEPCRESENDNQVEQNIIFPHPSVWGGTAVV